jgi:hypothetical protein
LKIEDCEGQYGPQKKIVIKQSLPEGERWISGWVSLKDFKAEKWTGGITVELDVFQKGKFWNFKLPSKDAAKDGAVNAKLDEILEKVNAISRRLDSLGGEILFKKEDAAPGPNPPPIDDDDIPF